MSVISANAHDSIPETAYSFHNLSLLSHQKHYTEVDVYDRKHNTLQNSTQMEAGSSINSKGMINKNSRYDLN
eukprot:Ihof_evm6s339 gene=Ihof_evmTU6s339